jgi:hypothetical protein
VPSAEAPSDAAHTSHGWSHAALQQKPSAAAPLAHVVAVVAACPFLSAQAPAPLQVFVAPHSARGSVAMVDGLHVPLTPPGAWSAAAHAAQVAHVAVPQHTPSTQLPVAHSRQLATLQSAPAARLHEPPCVFCGWQVPLDAQ